MGLGKAKVMEGEEIDCQGTVIYGASDDKSFFKVFKDKKHQIDTYGKKRSNGKMKCNNEEFGDVAPGLPKMCWCDKDADQEKYEVGEGNIVEKCGT